MVDALLTPTAHALSQTVYLHLTHMCWLYRHNGAELTQYYMTMVTVKLALGCKLLIAFAQTE